MAPSFAFALVTKSLSFMWYSALSFTSQPRTQGPNLSCSSFLGNHGPARKLTNLQRDCAKPHCSVRNALLLNNKRLRLRFFLAQMPTQMPSFSICGAPFTWAAHSRTGSYIIEMNVIISHTVPVWNWK